MIREAYINGQHHAFEKMSVSLAWVHKMKDQGLISRSPVTDYTKQRLKMISDTNYIGNVANKNRPESKSWRTNPTQKKALLESISESNKATKGRTLKRKEYKDLKQRLGVKGGWDFKDGDLFVETTGGESRHVSKKFVVPKKRAS